MKEKNFKKLVNIEEYIEKAIGEYKFNHFYFKEIRELFPNYFIYYSYEYGLDKNYLPLFLKFNNYFNVIGTLDSNSFEYIEKNLNNDGVIRGFFYFEYDENLFEKLLPCQNCKLNNCRYNFIDFKLLPEMYFEKLEFRKFPDTISAILRIDDNIVEFDYSYNVKYYGEFAKEHSILDYVFIGLHELLKITKNNSVRFCQVIRIVDEYKRKLPIMLYCPAKEIFFIPDIFCRSNHFTHFCISYLFEEIFKKLNIGTINKLNKTLKEVLSSTFSDNISIGGDFEFEELEDNFTYNPISTDLEDERDIGKDGFGHQIEIRPEYEYKVQILVENTRELIKKLSNGYSKYISIKGDKFPLGAHIHFGLEFNFIEEDSELIEVICKVLDDFLGKKLIELSGIARKQYKKLTAFELKDWGFEYRTLPSAYLINPDICYIVLKIAHNLVKKLIKNRQLEYNNCPTKEDYINICELTEEEYNLFEKFVENYKYIYKGEAINYYWTDEQLKNKLNNLILNYKGKEV